ncbi:thiamine diphosphokinase [uncultured Limosilactobacillus sp.]|uniref:thiamine diphosphokinase n=1 Tax=uncultured Limosilactobacillus sp. TaxID=2837629 RepID=UPI0025E6B57A|nr:thiamine diphosphokinase [uncultured Limosilactobacillus sp.]
MNVVNLMVGGPATEIPLEIVLQHRSEPWIGVDYGATYLLQHGINPLVIVGDFDSTNRQEFNSLKQQVSDVRTLPAEKDITDTQYGTRLAIREFHPEQINIYGGTGGRLDQLLANLLMPLQKEFRQYLRRIRFIDRENLVSFYDPGSYSVIKEPRMRYLAFVNLTPVRGLNLPDEKYPLKNFNSEIPFAWSSNEFVGHINHFSFQQGIVAVIQSYDQIHGND